MFLFILHNLVEQSIGQGNSCAEYAQHPKLTHRKDGHRYLSSPEFIDKSVEEVIRLSMEDLKTTEGEKREKEVFKVINTHTDDEINSSSRRRTSKLVRQQRYMSPGPQQHLPNTTDTFTLRDLQEEMRGTP